MAARWVKKSDGRIEPYDEARIARAVQRAGRRAGSSEEIDLLAREIARSVTWFLGQRAERIPETATIAQAVDDALEDTGHAAIARAGREWREWRRRRRAEVRFPDAGPEPGGPARPAASPGDERGGLEVLSRSAARPWTKQRIVEELTHEVELEREDAEEVARAVEERVFAAGLTRITTSLLRELIDAELFERGYASRLGRLEVLGLPRPDLERLAFLGQGRPPVRIEDQVTRAALERYALDAMLGGRGAVAHRRGDVHLIGLGRPFRLVTGAVEVGDLLDPDRAAAGPLDVVRAMIRSARAAGTRYDGLFGLVRPEAALAPWARHSGLRPALEVLLDALVAPCPDDLPPAPEVALVLDIDALLDDPERIEVTGELLETLTGRGAAGAGVRVIVRLVEPHPRAASLLRQALAVTRAGAACDLVLGPGQDPSSRGLVPGLAVVQAGLVNLAGAALLAGRGERDRFSRALDGAVEALLQAFHRRHRHAVGALARPCTPLFGRAHPPEDDDRDPERLGYAVGVVGLEAAARYLTGEGPAENPRVAELVAEVLAELTRGLAASASRLGLGPVTVEEVPAGDAGIRLAALDLDRYPDARELLGEAPGWDTGLGLRGDDRDPLPDLPVRLWLARQQRAPLCLARPELAAAPEPNPLADGLLETLRRRSSRLR